VLINQFYINIGNSDNKLTQDQWSSFCESLEYKTRVAIHRTAPSYYTSIGVPYGVAGVWYSLPNSPYQNMCISYWVDPRVLEPVDVLVALRTILKELAIEYSQDSIALTQGHNEMVLSNET
jgi:hypothetical protein